MEYIYTFSMENSKILTYEDGKQESDLQMFKLRKARARGDLDEVLRLESLMSAFDNEGTLAKVRSLMNKSASLGDEPNTKMSDLDLYTKPGVTDSEGVSHAVEIESKDESGKPLGRVPNGARGREVNKNNAKANRYLKYQEARIKKAILNQQGDKAVLLGLLILKNSYSYQIYLLNKVRPGGHHQLDKLGAKSLLEQVVRHCRSSTFRMFITRFYILKADGVRGRPIGCPDYPSRVISRGINDLIYTVFTPHSYQHGFVRGRNCGTALGNVIQNLKRNPKVVYEFDLKSFFNTVDINAVGSRLVQKSHLLAEVVGKIHHSVIYKLPREGLKDEAELKKVGYMDMKGYPPRYERFGMPQGLSISPILSILSMELSEAPKGVDMFADDGIYCGKSMGPFDSGVKQISDGGVELALNKSHPAGRYIDFLGCTIDRFERTISFREHLYSGDNPDLAVILQKIYNGYGTAREEKSWTGFVHPGSYTAMHNPGISDKVNFPFWDGLVIWLRAIFKGLPHMGYRYFPGRGIIDIIGGSSYACNGLLSIKKELNLGAIKPLCPAMEGMEHHLIAKKKVRRSTYYETIGVRAPTMQLRQYMQLGLK